MAHESERKELWHQLDNESDRAHEAFKVFMYLPPALRSVVRAWREWTGNPDAKRESPFFLRWSHDFAWSERARAHDHHLEVLREEGMEGAIKEEAARQAKAVEQTRHRFHELMAMAYERAIEHLESDAFVEQLRPSDVVQILKVHLETTHKLGGPTDALGGSTSVDWTEDEQRELDKLLGEIEAGDQDRDSKKSEEGEESEDGQT